MASKGIKFIIATITRLFAKAGISYSESQYIIKEVRKNLELKAPKSKKGTVKRLMESELKIFLEAAFEKSGLVGLMVLTLYNLGGRVAEFVNLDANDIFPLERKIVIRHGKGDKRREVPITQDLAWALQYHLKGRKEGPLFYSQLGKRFSTRRIQQLVQEIREPLDLSIEATPHTFRHTRATLMVENGISKELLMSFLGHSKMESTEIYTNTANVGLEKAFREMEEDKSKKINRFI